MILNDFHDVEMGDDGREDYNDENWCEMEIPSGLHLRHDDEGSDAFSIINKARKVQANLAKFSRYLMKYQVIIEMFNFFNKQHTNVQYDWKWILKFPIFAHHKHTQEFCIIFVWSKFYLLMWQKHCHLHFVDYRCSEFNIKIRFYLIQRFLSFYNYSFNVYSVLVC